MGRKVGSLRKLLNVGRGVRKNLDLLRGVFENNITGVRGGSTKMYYLLQGGQHLPLKEGGLRKNSGF